MMNYPWSESAVAILRDMADKGATAREIAAALGENVTRNAVIGKAQRMGIWLKGKQPRPIEETPREEPELTPNVIPFPHEHKRPPKPPRVIQEQPAPKALQGNMVYFLDAKPGMCRFPMGGRGVNLVFCGEAADTGSWCDEHRKVVFYPKPGVKRDGEEVELSAQPDGFLPNPGGGSFKFGRKTE